MKKIIHKLLLLSLLIGGLQSCQKWEYAPPRHTNFGEVYFDASNVAINREGQDRYLQIRTNKGFPVEWRQDGRISAPEGEHTFEFYDKRTGETLLEKTVDIVIGQTERYTLFQPTLDASLIFLDKNAQANEEAAPEGYYKVKLVDYTGKLFFNDKVDVIMWKPEFSWITFTTEWVEIGSLATIGTDLEGESYHLVPIQSTDEGLGFSFREAETGKQLTTVAGKEFLDDNFYKDLVSESEKLPDPKKNVFTAYIEAYAIDYQNDNFLRIGDKLYGIRPVIFLKN